ncbi:MAG: serine hydrolase, partial [Acidobacteriota bacterium]
MKPKELFFTFLTFFTVIALGLAGASAQAPAYNLDATVAAAMKAFDVPGMAVAVVKDGQVVSAKGYGVKTLGQPASVDERTLFG